jgi:hypothetical protein
LVTGYWQHHKIEVPDDLLHELIRAAMNETAPDRRRFRIKEAKRKAIAKERKASTLEAMTGRKILEYLGRNGPSKADDVAWGISRAETAVRRQLQRMAKCGKAKRVRRGVYGLPDAPGTSNATR